MNRWAINVRPCRDGNCDLLLKDPDTSGWQAVVPAQYASFNTTISDQLRICCTKHTFFSDYDRRVLGFFNTYR
jgi:hypothetical protein